MRASYSKAAAFALVGWLASCGGGPNARDPKPRSDAISARTLALVQTAQDHERQRRYDLARAAYQKAIAEAPDQPSGAFAGRKMASALLFWGEYADAAHALDAVLKLSPDDVSAWHDLGMVRARLGDPAGAETAFRRSIELRPAIPLSRLALAALLVNQRRFEEALAEYDELLARDLPERYRNAIHKAQRMIRDEMRFRE